jgi:hypothetical protein
MRRPACSIRRLGAAWFLLAALPPIAHAYDLTSHQQLSQAAFDVSGLASTLREGHGIFPADTFGGRSTLFKYTRLTPLAWIAKGARDEDWAGRPINHFYDPYHDIPLGIGVKAPDWALEDGGDLLGQDYSYKDARDAFYRALTARDPATHDRELGHTFYALGHVIHLIQDMAQPQHTRNDKHPDFIPPKKSWMEMYIERLAVSRHLNSLFRLNVDPASVPNVARVRDLWVTGIGDQMTGFGMSTFSNANFVSAGTNFTALRPFATADFFPRPVLDLNNVSTLSPTDTCKDGAQAPGFLTFYGNGIDDPVAGRLDNPRMTTYSFFDQYLIAQGRRPIFALNCFNLDTAATILLPRAVSFSAGLLKYFFRGRLEIASPDRYVYGLAAFQPGNTGSFTKLRFRVRNITPNEEAGPGLMSAVVRYRVPVDSAANLIDAPLADISGPRFAISRPLEAVTPTSSFQEFVFDFTQDPIPTNSADLFLTVVFKGSLGQEADAVMVGGKNLYEPDPLDKANGTDYQCFQGEIFYVADLPRYQYPDHTERDVNGDRVPDLYGPLVERTLSIKTFPLDQSIPGGFDYQVAELSAGRSVRFMLLQDQPWYGVSLRDTLVQDVSTGAAGTYSAAVQLNGILNDVSRGPAGEIVRTVNLPFIDRGARSLHAIALETSDTIPCQPEFRFVSRDWTRVEGCLPVADCLPVE